MSSTDISLHSECWQRTDKVERVALAQCIWIAYCGLCVLLGCTVQSTGLTLYCDCVSHNNKLEVVSIHTISWCGLSVSLGCSVQLAGLPLCHNGSNVGTHNTSNSMQTLNQLYRYSSSLLQNLWHIIAYQIIDNVILNVSLRYNI